MKVDANRVYVIPPAKHLTLAGGYSRLSPPEPERGKRVAVELFFRSLADTHGPHAAILSRAWIRTVLSASGASRSAAG